MQNRARSMGCIGIKLRRKSSRTRQELKCISDVGRRGPIAQGGTQNSQQLQVDSSSMPAPMSAAP